MRHCLATMTQVFQPVSRPNSHPILISFIGIITTPFQSLTLERLKTIVIWGTTHGLREAFGRGIVWWRHFPFPLMRRGLVWMHVKPIESEMYLLQFGECIPFFRVCFWAVWCFYTLCKIIGETMEMSLILFLHSQDFCIFLNTATVHWRTWAGTYLKETLPEFVVDDSRTGSLRVGWTWFQMMIGLGMDSLQISLNGSFGRTLFIIF